MRSPRDRPAETGEWWRRLDELYERAIALPEPDRASFVDEACPDDPRIRAELASLLAHAAAGDAALTRLADPHSGNAGLDPSAAIRADSMVGRAIGPYRIRARLGAGGMGVVYDAWDTRLNRPVALKFVWPDLAGTGLAKARFLAEARAAAAVDHPNTCTIYEVGESPEGAPFIAMARYTGETLKAKLGRGPLSIEDAVDAIVQIAEGTRAAHDRGVVHRDIKPGNILITLDGVAILLDFGIAVSGGTCDGPGTRGLGPPAVGSIDYMSPEQLCGETVDARTDIWSLGVVLYEMLAGLRPFERDHRGGTGRAVLHEAPVPLVAIRPEVPAALDGVIQRALAKRPGDRQRSAAELIAEIRYATGHRLAPTRAGSRKGRRIVRFSAGAVAVVLAAGGLAAIAMLLTGRTPSANGGTGSPPSTLLPDAFPAATSVVRDEDPGRAYLEGRFVLRRAQRAVYPEPADLLRSNRIFREITERNPAWAPGWAALGESYHWLASMGIDAPTHYASARDALERALRIDPTLGRAHVSLGFVLHNADFDYEGAEARYRHALALGTDGVWHGYGLLFTSTGRYDEAIEALRRAEAAGCRGQARRHTPRTRRVR